MTTSSGEMFDVAVMIYRWGQSLPLGTNVTTDHLVSLPLCVYSDLNRLVMDYLVIEGYKDAADSFSKESGLKPFVDSDSILNRMIIRGAIQRGDVDDAIGRSMSSIQRYVSVTATAAKTEQHRSDLCCHRYRQTMQPLLDPLSNDDNLFHAPRLATGSSGSLCADTFYTKFIHL